LIHQAILERRQVVFRYEDLPREVCPYILGHKGGVEKVLAFQFAGQSSSGLPARGDWKCFAISKMHAPRMREGPWHGAAEHRKVQRCVDDVYIDVNTDVPNQPGRR
jgi:predicted DNA-binding transcriptional regulator YafY